MLVQRAVCFGISETSGQCQRAVLFVATAWQQAVEVSEAVVIRRGISSREQPLAEISKLLDLAFFKAPSRKPLDVDALHGTIKAENHVGRCVGGASCHASDEAVLADRDELLNTGEAADDDIVLDLNVACDLNQIGEDAVVADLDVMGEVRSDLELIVAADLRHTAGDFGAGVRRDALSKDVVVTDDEFRTRALILEILRWGTHDAGGVEVVAGADGRVAQDGDVGHQSTAGANADFWPDVAARTDLDILGQLGFGINCSTGCDVGHRCHGFHTHILASIARTSPLIGALSVHMIDGRGANYVGSASTIINLISACVTTESPTRALHLT